MPYWYDYLLLSQGPRTNFVDYAWRNTPLPAGGAYTVTQEVTIPPMPAGTCNLQLRANLWDLAEENRDNNSLTVPITIVTPDMVALSASAPSSVVAGEWFDVTAVVSNAGPVAAYHSWSDVIYISPTSRLTPEAVRAGQSSPGDTAPGSVYRLGVAADVPGNLTGDLFLLFVADGYTNLFDANFENNVIALPLRVDAADLVPVSFSADPLVAAPGQPLALNWTVENRGTAPATRVWTDEVWLTTDAAGSNMFAAITWYWNEAAVPAQSSYVRSETIHCPAAPPGTYFLALKINDGNDQAEVNHQDNTLTVPITITEADLVADSITGPAVIAPQEPFDVTWTVRNLGPTMAYPDWNDTVYLAPVGDSSQALDILTQFSPDSPLAPGATYTQTQNVSSSWLRAGDYSLVVNTLYPFYPPDLNANNRTSVPIRIAGPDLVAVAITAPASASVGSNAQMSLLISNAGPVTAYPPWECYFYLSPSNGVGPGNIYLANVAVSASLTSGSTTSITVEVDFEYKPPGSWYLIGMVDPNRLSDPDPANNAVSTPFTLRGPDLVPQWISPATGIVAAAQQMLDLQWTVRNVGDGPAFQPWFDTIEIETAHGYPNPRHLGDFFRLERLDAGASYTHTTGARLPPARPGNHQLVLRADGQFYVEEASETNNRVALPIQIISPDLTPIELHAPAVVDGQSTFEVSWRVVNLGPVEAFGPWEDRLYVSTQNHITADAIQVSWEPHYDRLEVYGTYAVTQWVTLPALTLSNYYLIIKTDGDFNLFDPVPENDELVIPLTIRHPDLATRSFSGYQSGEACPGPYPASAHPYAPNTDLRWTNTCPGALALAVMFDYQAELGSGDQIHIMDGAGNEIPGSPFEGWELGSARRTVVGDTVIVRLRSDGIDESWGFSINSIYPFIERPLGGLAPQENVNVLYTVENLGPARAASGWYDQIYFSRDTVIDSEDRPLFDELYGAPELDVGSRYAGLTVAQIPGAPAGNYYLIVKANVYTNLAETSYANNEFVLPIAVAGVDLELTSFEAPDQAAPHQTITVLRSFRNNGPVRALPPWRDSFYLSKTPVLGHDAINVGYFWENDVLDAGGTDSDLIYLGIPEVPPGDYYLIAHTDANNNLGDAAGTNNFMSVPIRIVRPDLVAVSLSGFQITGSCEGPYPESTEPLPNGTVWRWVNSCPGASALQITFDPDSYVAYSDSYILVMDGNRNHISTLDGWISPLRHRVPGDTVIIEFHSSYHGDRFRVTDISSLVETTNLFASPQGEIDVQWRVQNNGSGVAASYRIDQFYLSADPYLQSSDLVIDSFTISSTLVSGVDYLEQRTLHIDAVPAGSYHLLLKVDNYNYQTETNEGNNFISVPITIGPPADLRPLEFNVPATLEANRALNTIEVSWTITNQGAATASLLWHDTIYFSRDSRYNPGDYMVGTHFRPRALAAGETYTATQQVVLQVTNSGTYYLLLWTDGPYYGDDPLVYEADETNNIVAVPIQVNLVLPDLVVTEFEVQPVVVSIYDYVPFRMRWVVHNQGVGVADRYWYDTVYINGQYARMSSGFAPLPPGSSYTNEGIGHFAFPSNGIYSANLFVDNPLQCDCVLESNETNNSRSASLLFNFSPPHIVLAGEDSRVPVWFATPAPVSTVEFELFAPRERLSGIGVWPYGPPPISRVTGTSLGQGWSQLKLRFETHTNQFLTGTQQIGQLELYTGRDQSSAFVTFSISNLVARNAQSAIVPGARAHVGRAVIIGPEPLLEAATLSPEQHALTIYGLPGSNVIVQTKPSLTAETWSNFWQGTFTNRFQSLGPFPSPNPSRFYRARY